MDRVRTAVSTALVGGVTLGGALLLIRSDGAPPGVLAGAAPVHAAAEISPVAHARGARLEATTPAQAREVITFARSSSSSDVPELRAMALDSDNPLVAGNAVRALGRLGEVSGDDELLQLLDDPRPRVRQELVRALGQDGDARAVPRLAGVLRGADPALRPLALQALGRIGGGEARAILERVRDDAEAPLVERVFARQALATGVASRSGGARQRHEHRPK